MPFAIPNEADAFHTDQAEIDSVDFGILAAIHNADGVLYGCAVTAQGTPDMTVAVAVGAIVVDGVRAAVTAGNVTITAANGTNPRFDLIVSNSSGTLSATAGTAAANPVFPAIPANSVVLAAVYVPANDTTIASNQITDKRLFTGISFERFTSSGTWTKPIAATSVLVVGFAGGAGGGGGRGAAAGGARHGGGGGSGGVSITRILPASILGATETVTIGAGGAGGAGGSSADGAAGSAGGDTTFGAWFTCDGGNFGAGGTTGSAAAGTSQVVDVGDGAFFSSIAGLTGGAGGATGTAASASTSGCPGGGGGGGATAGDVQGAGGDGGGSPAGVGGTAGAAGAGVGGAGTAGSVNESPGAGGGGGGGSASATGGAGGAGGIPAGGGGGGGGGTTVGGAGGAGARGEISVWTW